MFKKNEEIKEEKTIIMKGEDMTYTELVSQELNTNLGIVEREITDIENKINELTVDINKTGNDPRLIEVINRLREDVARKEKERYQVSRQYTVDLELLYIAAQLDRADRDNKGLDLLHKLAQKPGDMYFMLLDIEKCYGNTRYAPIVYHQMSGQIQALVLAISANLPSVQRIDSEVLKQKLSDRMKIVDKSRVEAKAMKDKYKKFEPIQ